MEDHGNKLFDVFSESRLRNMLQNRRSGKEIGAFDMDFYMDQKGEREFVIETQKMTRSYYEEKRKFELISHFERILLYFQT